MSPMKLLVVDDERAVRESLRRALELEGYDVELASDGEDALQKVDSDAQPDAVILDVLMPGLDGLEVCRHLRRTGNRLPVLMLTARDEVENRVAGLDAGTDDYVTKPFALEESTRAQRQLVSDASHELRTPLTSLRTNIEVLAREQSLPPGERERLLNDVIEQIGELTTLISELMDLARGGGHQAEPEDGGRHLDAAAPRLPGGHVEPRA